jgi:hypothetical protein
VAARGASDDWGVSAGSISQQSEDRPAVDGTLHSIRQRVSVNCRFGNFFDEATFSLIDRSLQARR